MKLSTIVLSLATVALSAAACGETLPSENASPSVSTTSVALRKARVANRHADLSPELQRVVAQVDELNARLASAGSDMRLHYPWMFTIGQGADPFAQLRTGARWIQNEVSYIIDASDHTMDAASADVEAALLAAFETWDAVPNASLSSVQSPDPGGNFDVLDGAIEDGECETIFDLETPNFDPETGNIFPEADVVFGGWLPPDYFVLCLGNENILGVTWFFSGGDANGDNFADQLYVEQFYNDGFEWATTGSVYLDFTSPIDIESIILHEVGHTHGLGHFGGPVNRQPFTLKPNLRVFNPEAVMNPFYLNGEKRVLLPTDVAGFVSLYGRNE